MRRRARVSWTLALLTLLTLLAMLHRVHRDGIPVDFTPQALFIDKGEEIERLRQFEDTFGREDNTILFLLSDLPHTSEGVDALHTLHETLEAHPDVEEVVSPVGATVLVDENGSLRAVDPLAERPATEAWSLLASSVATRKLLVSDNADTVALRVRLSPNLDRVADLAPRVHAVTQTAAGVSLPSPAILEPTGVPFVRTEITGKLVEDQTLFVPMVGVLFAVTIIALFRRLFLGMAPLLAVGLADIWTLGILIGGGATLNVLSILVPTLVLVIGIADGIHITARYREELDAGHAPDHAMGLTIEAMALPCFLTTFTTGAGFISLWVADTAVIRNFGTHCSIAMAVTFVGILTLLPTLLAWIPVDRVRSSSHGQAPTHRTLRTIDRMVARRPAMVLLGCFLVSGLAATLGVAVEANSRLLEMYREDAPTYQAIKKSEARLTGVIPMFYVLEADIDDAWKDPHKLAQLDTLEQAVSAEPDVLWATSLASYTHELHALLSDGSTRLPNSREAIAQELLIGELAGSAMPPNLLSEDGRQVRVMFLVADSGGRALLPMRDRLDAIAASLFTDLTTTPRLSGDGMLAAAGIDRLINDLLSSLSLMFLVILGTLSILLRDLRLALVACVPNAIPLVFTLGTLGWMGADLGVTNVVSFTVAVGLAVDDTIHFIVRFQAERQRTPDLGAAVTATFLGAGHPIILTSVLLVAGFFVLSLSELTSTRHFGILSSVTMIAALVGDLLFLPALLHLGRRWLAGTPSKP
ncbi:MAG: hypothetical protein CL927_03765 [Deltaproteobacteria bacterium]|nr:hypothetical protein [Deltaproteobacteria bacterium]